MSGNINDECWDKVVATNGGVRMVTERDIAGDIPQAAPHQEPQFMSMAMAMVVAAGTCHINSLQLFSCPAAQHSHRKTLVICTSVSKTGAFVGNCYPTIAWPQRRSFELRSRRDASKSLRRSENIVLPG